LSVDLAAAQLWIRRYVDVAGPIEPWHERPWSTVLRIPLADGAAWFKACAPVQAFEPRLTRDLFSRWPDRVPEVLACDQGRGWLILRDAGTPIRALGNPPDIWLTALPLYAELQRSEVAHANDHLAHGVPDLRIQTLPGLFDDLLRHNLPLERLELLRLREFGRRLADLCQELAAANVPETLQHDDLHAANVYTRDHRLRFLDWGDTSISHPFMSLVVTFRFLEETNHLSPVDPWFARLRDAYLEPWGGDLAAAFDLAIGIGAFAHAIAWARQRDYLPANARPSFDKGFAIVLQRALARIF